FEAPGVADVLVNEVICRMVEEVDMVTEHQVSRRGRYYLADAAQAGAGVRRRTQRGLQLGEQVPTQLDVTWSVRSDPGIERSLAEGSHEGTKMHQRYQVVAVHQRPFMGRLLFEQSQNRRVRIDATERAEVEMVAGALVTEYDVPLLPWLLPQLGAL